MTRNSEAGTFTSKPICTMPCEASEPCLVALPVAIRAEAVVAGTDPMRRDVATPDAALCATSSDSGPSAASPISDATALADCADVGASPYGRSPSRSMIVGNLVGLLPN